MSLYAIRITVYMNFHSGSQHLRYALYCCCEYADGIRLLCSAPSSVCCEYAGGTGLICGEPFIVVANTQAGDGLFLVRPLLCCEYAGGTGIIFRTPSIAVANTQAAQQGLFVLADTQVA
jgi:hypothetical protein